MARVRVRVRASGVTARGVTARGFVRRQTAFRIALARCGGEGVQERAGDLARVRVRIRVRVRVRVRFRVRG